MALRDTIVVRIYETNQHGTMVSTDLFFGTKCNRTDIVNWLYVHFKLVKNHKNICSCQTSLRNK